MELIQLNNVSKKFNDFSALDDVDFRVHRGEIFGCLGPNGAGKTTTIRILLGLLLPTKGSVEIFGEIPGDLRNTLRERIGVILENPGVYDDLSVYDNLLFYAKIYKIKNVKKRIQSLIEFVGIKEKEHEMVSRLSKGMKQKLAIARALLHDPKLLIFDEPTAGLDPIFKKEIRKLLDDLRNNKKTIFLSSHNLSEVQTLCDRVAFLKKGKIIAINSVNYFLNKYKNLKKTIILKNEKDFQKSRYLLKDYGVIIQTLQNKKIDVLFKDTNKSKQSIVMLQKNDIKIVDQIEKSLDLEDIFCVLMKE